MIFDSIDITAIVKQGYILCNTSTYKIKKSIVCILYTNIVILLNFINILKIMR